jgi:hypothetical protein
MDCFLMQDWTTIRGAGSSSVESVTQMSDCWLDMGPYQDVIAWLAVREVTPPVAAGTVYLDLQTAPVRDELYFLSMIGGSPAGQALTAAGASLAPTVLNLGRDFAVVPVSRWLRWKLTTGGVTPTQSWDATFSIWIAANFRLGGDAARGRAQASGGNAPGVQTRLPRSAPGARMLLPPNTVWLGARGNGNPNVR